MNTSDSQVKRTPASFNTKNPGHKNINQQKPVNDSPVTVTRPRHAGRIELGQHVFPTPLKQRSLKSTEPKQQLSEKTKPETTYSADASHITKPESTADAYQYCLRNLRTQYEKLLTFFYLKPTESEFRQLEMVVDQIDLLQQRIDDDYEPAYSLVFVLIKISDKHHWPIQSPRCSKLATDIREQRSYQAILIHDDRVTVEKLALWWQLFFATGDDSYLKQIAIPIELPAENPPPPIFKLKPMVDFNNKAAAEWSFLYNCGSHQYVKDFTLKMSRDNSLSRYKREFFRCACTA